MLVFQQSPFLSIYLLKGQDPAVKEKSSIAMPHDWPFPGKASNVTCQKIRCNHAKESMLYNFESNWCYKVRKNQVKSTKTYQLKRETSIFLTKSLPYAFPSTIP